MIKTVAELAEHITWMYTKIEYLNGQVQTLKLRVDLLEGKEAPDHPPWEGENELEGTRT